MPSILTVADRYQISGEPVGEGGMGIVYKAYDPVTRRHVALKTMRGSISPSALELFAKEWTVLSRVNHPNIVNIFDTGEFEEGGQKKPFFVMPFLPGRTFDYLIRNASQRLTVERVVGIIAQTCRGLQAAHENGLVHRDLKPSNIFVGEDDTVTIIDFGVVHLAGTQSIAGLKGTVQYMAPEQIDLKPTSPASDIFSLAVVCYEALTGRKPFERRTEEETMEAVRRYVPPPVCELNPLANEMLSRVIHKAMVKAPFHRFSSAREFADNLQKALNNEPIERFEKSKTQPRIARARRALAEGELQFASELLGELEAEGHFDPEMTLLRVQINQTIRQKSIRQGLDTVRACREAGELPLALQKIQEVLDTDADNPEAIALRRDIEKELSDAQVENWFRLAAQHLHNRSFTQARHAFEEILKVDVGNTRAREALLDVDRREKEIARMRGEKEHLYQAAVENYGAGEISSAMSKMERLMDVSRTSPDCAIPDRDAQYERFYNQIRTEREETKNALADARRCLSDKNYDRALEICSDFLNRYPGDALFQALKLEAAERRRQEYSAFIADVARRADAEADLDRRVNILKEAVDRYPDEPTFQQSLRLIRERRDLVNSIVTKARQYEDRSQFADALGQWDILRNIYPQYPGLEFEVERLARRRDEQARAEARARWVDDIDRALAGGDHARARDLVKSALVEFPEDRELLGLERVSQQALERASEAAAWLQRGQQLCFDREYEQGLEALRKAASLDPANSVIRAALLNALVEQARSVLGQDWRAAEPLIRQALTIDGDHRVAKNLQALILDYKRQEIVTECVTHARDLQASGDIAGAIARIDEGLKSFPNEVRLVDLRSRLAKQLQPEKVSREEPPPAPVSSPKVERAEKAEAAAVGQDSNLYPSTVMLDESFGSRATPPSQRPVIPPPPSEPPPAARQEKRVEPKEQPQPEPESSSGIRSLIPRFSSREWAVVALVPVLAFAAIWLLKLPKKLPAPVPIPLAHDFPVNVTADAPGAAIAIDGSRMTSSPQRFPAGKHTLLVTAPGYQTASSEFTLGAAGVSAYNSNLHLEPEPVKLRVSSDLKSGRIAIDDRPPVDLQDGNFSDEQVALGMDHKLTILQSGKPAVTFSFRAQAGQPVAVTSPLDARQVYALAISNLAGQTKIYGAGENLKAGIAGQAPQSIPASGLAFNNLQPDAELVAEYGGRAHPLPLQVSNAPTLNLVISSDPNTATLRIVTKVPDAEVSIDNRKPRHLRGTSLSLLLPPGKYSVRVSKAGYTDLTESVELKKGASVSLPPFDLAPIPKLSSFTVEGGTAGAELWLDNQRVGSIGTDGAFSKDGISPGSHIVTLKKADFDDKELVRSFTAGQPVRLNGNDARLAPFAALTFRTTPANATITYKRDQEKQEHAAANGNTIHVSGGRYTVSATAPNFQAGSQQITLAPGATQIATLTLQPIPTTTRVIERAPEVPDPKSWTPKDGWYEHAGKGIAPWPVHGNVIRVHIKRPDDAKVFGISKVRHISWVIEDGKQEIVYQLDRKSIQRKLRSEQGEAPKHAIDLGTAAIWNLEIEIRPDHIEVRANGNSLDTYDRPTPGAPIGRFAFDGEVTARPE